MIQNLLSPREFEYLELAAMGFNNRQIGNLMFVQSATIDTVFHRIYDKLGVRALEGKALRIQAIKIYWREFGVS